MNENKAGLKEIPPDRIREFKEDFEDIVESALLAENVAFIQSRNKVIFDFMFPSGGEKDTSHRVWSFRKSQTNGDSHRVIHLVDIHHEFEKFYKCSLEEILNNETACGIIKKMLDPVTLHEIMSLPEIIESAFLKKFGIIKDANLALDTSINLDEMVKQ